MKPTSEGKRHGSNRDLRYDGHKTEEDSVVFQSHVNGFVLSPLPELGTMGSKWGGAGATGSSTSFATIILNQYRIAR